MTGLDKLANFGRLDSVKSRRSIEFTVSGLQ